MKLAHHNTIQFHPSSFVLLGIPGLENRHTWIGFSFCAVYLIATLGNIILLSIIWAEPSLHQSMLHFLALLACTDLSLSTTTIPKMLGIFWFNLRDILFVACLAQMFMIHLCTSLESGVITDSNGHQLLRCYMQSPEMYHDPHQQGGTHSGHRHDSKIFNLRHPFCVSHLAVVILWCQNTPHTYCEHVGVARLSRASIRANNLFGMFAFSVGFIDLIVIGFSYAKIVYTVFHLPSWDA